MSDLVSLLAIMEGGKPAFASSGYDREDKNRQRKQFDEAVREIRALVRDAETARMDANGLREVMVAQARQIAELEADVARLTRASEIASTESQEHEQHLEKCTCGEDWPCPQSQDVPS